MLKISSKYSVVLSLGLAGAFLLVLVVCAVGLPWIAAPMVVYANESGALPPLAEAQLAPVLVLGYLCLATMALADGLLIALLRRVKKGEVFTARSVGYIRGVSWCCFLLCLWLAVLGVWFQLSLAAAVAVVFLGLCLRVVKNVMEQATAIKEENDFTV